MSEIIGDAAETLGADVIATAEADLPGLAAKLHAKVDQVVADLEAHHTWIASLVADLQRYGVPIPSATANAVPQPASTIDDTAPAAPAEDTTAAPAAEDAPPAV